MVSLVSAPSSAVHLEKSDEYLSEVWAEYGVGVFVICLRFAVRIRTIGPKGFQGDDYLAILALLLFTVDAIMCHSAYFTGGNIDVTRDQVDSLSDEDVAILVLGSKFEFVTWYSYPSFIWTLKFSILFFYRRLTSNGRLTANHMLTILFWFCGLTYATLMVTISSTCRPYSKNWQIRPLPGLECIFRAQNFIALAVLNIVTDMAILAIPVPILWQLRISWWRKLAVSLLLCGGLFVITAAIVRAALTLGSSPSVITVNLWGFRETVVALVAVSAPVLSPLFRPAFWRWGEYRGPADRARAELKNKPRSGLWDAGRKIFPQSLFGSSLGSGWSWRSAALKTPVVTVTKVTTVREEMELETKRSEGSEERDIEAATQSSFETANEIDGLDSPEIEAHGASEK